jgi:SNF2 family DNA or RNA helicase
MELSFVQQPRNLTVNLYQHQLISIYNMEKLERTKIIEKDNFITETSIGINADPTGYGKTLSMIGLITRDKMEWDTDTPFIFENITSVAGGRIKKHQIKRYDKINTTLILVSQSIIGQWEEEFKKTDLKVKIVTSRKIVDDAIPGDYDVILVTPTMYNKLILTHSSCAWKRFIFDEPGHLKIPAMKEIQAGFYWFVTATPNSIMIQHRNCKTSFMKNIIGGGWLDFETQFSGMIMRNSIECVRQSFEMPATTYYYYECFQPIYNIVNGFISTNIVKMIEAGNIEGAIESLGGNKTKNIVELVRRRKQEELEEINSKIRIYTIRCDDQRISEWNNRKTHIESQIEEIENRFQNILTIPCHICLEPLDDPVLEPGCQNIFCGKCLLKWLQKNNSCPLCRSNVNREGLVYIDKGVNSSSGSHVVSKINRGCTKLETIINIIKNKPFGKFLIFSSYDSTFVPICNTLHDNNILFSEVRGGCASRQKSILSFKDGKTSVIFLNSNFNGAGINLQEATDVILYHEMNENIQNQILGRANRIGRVGELQVHYLQIKT